jgi:plastocyanin
VTSVRTPPIALALVALAVLAVSGCGSPAGSASGDGGSPPDTTPATTPASTASTTSGSPSTSVARPTEVDIVDGDFAPNTITVHEGDQVVWLNEDDVDHWVISAPGTPQPFDLGRQGSAGSASRTFRTKGRYSYFCNLHNYMKGEVVVQ